MGAAAYFAEAHAALDRVAAQSEAIEAAARLLVECIVDGGALWSFGASHSFMLTEELVYRTGGLMLVNPIYPHGMNTLVRPMPLTSQLERVVGLGKALFGSVAARAGDALLLASTSGRNAVAIDMALAAREKGVSVIGITSVAYSSGVTSRHPSGCKMPELCTLVLDNGAPYGDAAVELPGLSQRVGPLSSVTGCALVNALVTEVVAKLLQKGVVPPVYMSANLDGGDEHNADLLARYRDRIHYLE